MRVPRGCTPGSWAAKAAGEPSASEPGAAEEAGEPGAALAAAAVGAAGTSVAGVGHFCAWQVTTAGAAATFA